MRHLCPVWTLPPNRLALSSWVPYPLPRSRCYRASDNLGEPGCRGLTPADLIDVAVGHDLYFDAVSEVRLRQWWDRQFWAYQLDDHVPRGTARIRVQLSAAHSDADVDRAVAAFAAARERIEA